MFQPPLRAPAGAPPTGVPSTSGQGGRTDLSRVVRRALSGDRLRLAYQPVVTAEARPEVALYEGFIRILDELGREISANGFVAAVEDSPLGREIDCASLRLGITALRLNSNLRLSINLSARSIGNTAWRNLLEEGAQRVGHRLLLEVSESSLSVRPEQVGRLMQEMRPMGVRFALDDFGSGSIALLQLREFGFHQAKIDRSLVGGIDQSSDHQAVAGALISVAHQFGIDVVAEGVETEEEADHMRALGADYLQGYLFGRPKIRL